MLNLIPRSFTVNFPEYFLNAEYAQEVDRRVREEHRRAMEESQKAVSNLAAKILTAGCDEASGCNELRLDYGV
jgi:hypothetical protein